MRIEHDLNSLSNYLVEYYNTYDSGDAVLTPSGIGQSVRKLILTHRHKEDFNEKASSLFKMSLGSVMHDQILMNLKRNYPEQLVVEERFESVYKGYKLGGTPDLFVVNDVPGLDLKAGSLFDLKTVNIGSWLYNDDDFESYRQQLLFNRFLLENNGYEVKDMKLWFVFTDWTPYKKIRTNDCPEPSEYVTETRGRDDFLMILDNKLEELSMYEDVHDNDLPDCSPKDTWMKPPWKVYELKKDGKPKARAMAYGSFFSKAEAESFSEGQRNATVVQYKKELDRPGCQSCFCRHWCNMAQGGF